MKKYAISIMLSVLMGLFLTGCAGGVETFKTITENEVFQSVPMMAGETLSFTELEEVGDGNYQIHADNTGLEDYNRYLTLLEEEGFKKYADNGKEGLEGYVYISHYQKDNLLVVVTYYAKLQRTTITAAFDQAIPGSLIYKDEYIANNIEGKKTTLTMNELYTSGNSFIFQLKNGHFILNDGGQTEDLPYILDYLDELAPDGEKPIVDAWIVSHTHGDHMGPFVTLADQPKYAKRLSVEAIYYTAASDAAFAEQGPGDSSSALDFYVNAMQGLLKTAAGEKTPVYRMRTGERHYFNDITMDVVYTVDLLSHTNWKTWNATSTVLMYTVEGQKVFITADTDYECQMVLLDVYDDEYFNLDVYQTPHHGGNVYNEFTRHITVKTVLLPSPRTDRLKQSLLSRTLQNEYLSSRAQESTSFGDGGVRLTFPYEVGTYEKLPLIDWIYHKDELADLLNS